MPANDSSLNQADSANDPPRIVDLEINTESATDDTLYHARAQSRSAKRTVR